MRSVAAPVAAITALLVGVASAAPAPNGAAYGAPPSYTSSTPPAATSAADSSANTPPTGTTPANGGSKIIVVPTKTCGSPATATASKAAAPVSWTPTEKHQKACDDASYTDATADDPLMPADWEACAALYSEFVTLNGTFNIGTGSSSGGDSSAGSGTAPSYGSGYSSGGSSSGTKSGTTKPGGSSSGSGSSAPSYGTGYGKRDYGYGASAGITIGGKKIAYTSVLKSESCVFALATENTDKVFAIGDVDVSVIMKHALDKGSSGSMVGIRGNSKCASRGEKGVKGKVHFQMYYPGA